MQTQLRTLFKYLCSFCVFLFLAGCGEPTQLQTGDNIATNTQTDSVTNTDEATQTDTDTEASSTVTQTTTETETPVEITQLPSADWILNASRNVEELGLLIDGDITTRWATKQVQTPGQWISIDLQDAYLIESIDLDMGASVDDYLQGYEVYISDDGVNWGDAIASGVGSAVMTIELNQVNTQYIQIVQTGSSTNKWLSIHELTINGAPTDGDITETITDTETDTDTGAYICPTMETLLSDLNCTNSACHSVTPSQAAKISLTGSIEDLAIRFNDTASVSSNCSEEKVIDVANPSESLLLKLVSPHSGSQCSNKMPVGSDGVTDDQFKCFEAWVEEIANTNVDIEDPDAEPFVSLTGFSSLNKVKSFLHGGAVTDAEMNTGLNDNGDLDIVELRSMIQQWMLTSEFDAKISDFLQLTLQQENTGTDGGYVATLDALSNNLALGGFLGLEMIADLEESFVRTALRIVKDGRDFREIATTTTWDVTTSVLVAMSYHDYQNRRPFLRDEENPGILRQYSYFEDGDFDDWRQITFTKSDTQAYFNLGDPATAGNLRALVDGDSVAFKSPRVGFLTTIPFFQNWDSNVGNKFRVTTNQAMIVGTGLTFEAGDITEEGDLSGLDVEHAGADECFACHRLMDPMGQVFRNTYGINGTRALNTMGDTPAAFAFFGATSELNDMYDLAQAIHDHPNFAKAWTAKLCNWATSTQCDQTSDEFKRLVSAFVSSNYQLDDLILELFSSPLVTYSEYIDGIQPAPAVILNRTNHFCQNMQVRLKQVRTANGVGESNSTDLCNLSANIQEKAGLLAQDEFSRGALFLTQAVTLDPFLTSGYNQLCEETQSYMVAANAGVDGNNNYNKFFDQNDETTSIENMTSFILGYPPSHAQHDIFKDSLQKMYDIHRSGTLCSDTGQDIVDANADGVVCGLGSNRATALKQVWIAACSAPSVMSIGF
ncbi:discoidin domain-containing protein [Marinicellulosiphila megalodicopiae]|uniref:discoidin domain-containing protein n=1 Tax=Marinicellulosiphila megalodicopiae TaxID=2724896 RepID=UPI003BB03CC9